MSTDEHESTVRGIIREWWRTQIEGKDEVDVKTLADVGAAELKQDPEFRARFFEETIGPTIYNIGIAIMSDLHPQRGRSRYKTVSAGTIATAIEERGMDWSRWLVHDPISTNFVPFMGMSKRQILAAGKVRSERRAGMAKEEGFFALVAGNMKDDQVVGDAWTEKALDILVSRIVVSKPKVSLGPVGMTPIADFVQGDA